jgi:hypothetical protein
LPDGLRHLPRLDISIEVAVSDPTVDGALVDPELTSDAGLRKAPIQKMCE